MRVTSQHWECFLNICERHPNLITGKFNGAQGKAEGNTLWATVATKLNGLGLGEKSIIEWRRAVTDWKSKVKAKASRLKNSATQTGGGPCNIPPLTALEDRLVAIMGRKGFEGDQGIRELGIPSASSQQQPVSLCTPLQPYENVLQEIDVMTEPVSLPLINIQMPSQPSTSQFTTCDGIVVNKRKHTEAMMTIEHDYCEEPTMSPPPKKTKRLKRKVVPRISKNLEDMTSESLVILKTIEQNTSRIADAFEKVVEVFVRQQNSHE